MVDRTNQVRRVLAVYVVLILGSFGCAPVRLFSNLLHATGADLAPAEYDGLKGRRVAIVCVSDSLSYGPSTAATQLARNVGELLGAKVKDISIVPQRKVDEWFDQHDWENFDMPALGDGVGADAVLAIDLHNFSIYDGQTLYKGRADLEMVVYLAKREDDKESKDKGGEDEEKPSAKWRVDFRSEPPQIHYPQNAGITTTELSEPEFRRRFMGILSQRIARTFFAYDGRQDFAQDSSVLDR